MTSLVIDHDFRAAPRWWERCTACGLSIAAHSGVFITTRAAISDDIARTPYRCPECVTASEYDKPEPHAGDCPRAEESAA